MFSPSRSSKRVPERWGRVVATAAPGFFNLDLLGRRQCHMAINGCAVRDAYEACCNRGEHGRRAFIHRFYRDLGLCDDEGRRHWDVSKGRAVLESEHRKLRPSDVSLYDLAIGITGLWGGGLDRALESYARRNDPVRDVLEAPTPVTPTQFLNISVYNAAVTGLLEATVLEAYDKPAYISDSLARTIPTRKKQEKFIGVTIVGDAATDDDIERKPGAPHARTTLTERYAVTPETKNKGIAIEVTREAVMFDETAQVLQVAEQVTDRVRLRKEKAILDMVLGVTSSYNYGGTAYATYSAVKDATHPWANIIGSNPLTDWHDVDEALDLFTMMVDPERGEPIAIAGSQLLVMPQRLLNARRILDAAEVRAETNTGADTTIGGNPIRGQFELLPSSPWLYNRATAAKGLALSAANAKDLWLMGDFQRAFAYMENLPLTIIRATPSDYIMADHGLVAAIFLDEMGIPAVLEPRCVVKCKNEA